MKKIPDQQLTIGLQQEKQKLKMGDTLIDPIRTRATIPLFATATRMPNFQLRFENHLPN